MAPRDAASSHPQSNPVLSLPIPESLRALPTATTPPRPTAPRQAPPGLHSGLCPTRPPHGKQRDIFKTHSSDHSKRICASTHRHACTDTHAHARSCSQPSDALPRGKAQILHADPGLASTISAPTPPTHSPFLSASGSPCSPHSKTFTRAAPSCRHTRPLLQALTAPWPSPTGHPYPIVLCVCVLLGWTARM